MAWGLCPKYLVHIGVCEKLAKFGRGQKPRPFTYKKSFNNDILNTEKMPNYDLIVSNPPYIQKSDILKMNKNVTEFEPHRAIFVDDNNPIVFYRKIASLAIKSLNDGGYIFFEINELYHKEVFDLLNKIGFVDITLKNDINDKPRMIKACKK